MRAQTIRPHATRSLIVVLALLAMLSTAALTAVPAHAQPSSSDSWEAALELYRQSYAQLLAGYNLLDAEGRAAMDAGIPATADQIVQAMYSQLSTTEVAKLDEQIRQMTGYGTASQFLQSLNTVPSFYNGIPVVMDALHNVRSGGEAPVTTTPGQMTTTPTASPVTTGPATTTSPPGMVKIVFSQGDEVSVKGPDGEWRPVSKSGQLMPSGEVLSIRAGRGKAVITGWPGTQDKLWIDANTELEMDTVSARLNVLYGKVRMAVYKLLGGEKLNVRCQPFAASVRGTDFIMDTTPERTALVVFEGAVEFSDPEKGTAVLVEAGEFSVGVVGGIPAESQSLDDTSVFQEYASLFDSEDEIEAVKENMEQLVESREEGNRLGYLLFIPAVAIIGVTIGWAVRHRRKTRQA